MARFVGAVDEFNKYLGPWVRNWVQQFTRSYKHRIGACEDCGSTQRLQAAHAHGYERPALIEKVLSQHRRDGTLDVDLEQFGQELRAAHEPLGKTIRVLCPDCHRKYDMASDTQRVDQTLPQVRRDPGRGSVLPFSFEPADENVFKEQLLKTQLAEVTIYFRDGRIQQKTWKARQFGPRSNLRGNLRSREEFRQGNWQDAGIERVHVRISDRR